MLNESNACLNDNIGPAHVEESVDGSDLSPPPSLFDDPEYIDVMEGHKWSPKRDSKEKWTKEDKEEQEGNKVYKIDDKEEDINRDVNSTTITTSSTVVRRTMMSRKNDARISSRLVHLCIFDRGGKKLSIPKNVLWP